MALHICSHTSRRETSLEQLETLQVEAGEFTRSMVVDENHGKLYVGDKVVNLSSGVVATLAGEQYYNQWVKNESIEGVYAVGDFDVVAIDTQNDEVHIIEGIEADPEGILAVNPMTSEVFLSGWSRDPLLVIDGTTLEHTSVEDLAGFGLAVNWLQNKVYIAYCWGRLPLSPLAADFCIYDRDADTITRFTADDETIGNNDATELVFNPFADRIHSSAEINRVTTLIDGATDEWRNVRLPSASVTVRHATGNAYYASAHTSGPSRIMVMSPETDQVVVEFEVDRPTTSEPAFIGTSFAIHDALGRVFVAADQRDGAITVTDGRPCLCEGDVVCGTPGCVVDGGCRIDEFACGNGDCIALGLVCDGQLHCMNGADEQPC